MKRDGSVECWGTSFTPPAGEFVSVSAAFSHVCGVKTDGTVACWSWSYEGDRRKIATPPAGEFVSVSAGYTGAPQHVFSSAGGHTCGVRNDGSVACWGYLDEYEDKITTPPAGEFVSVSAGRRHVCGVKRDGSVACW